MGGGKATNSGISFQLDCNTYFLTAMLIDLSIDYIIPEVEFSDQYIEEVYSETSDEIDDIKLVTNKSKKIYIQAKNNLSGSYKENSDLYKSFKQFVNQFQLKQSNEYYVICTSHETVKNVRLLQRTLNEIRKNIKNYKNNSFNKAQIALLSEIKNMIKKIDNRLSLSNIDDLLKKTYILIIEPSIRNNIHLLDYIGRKSSDYNALLLWNLIMRDSTTSAKQGSSFSKKEIKEKYSSYIVEDKNKKAYNYLKNNFEFSFFYDYFIEYDKEKKQYSINGHNRIPNKAFKSKNVIKRFSTLQQAENYCKDNIDQEVEVNDFTKSIDNNSIEFIYYLLMKEKYLLVASKLNITELKSCIHCGNEVDSNTVSFVEKDFSYNSTGTAILKSGKVGVTHEKCIQGYDRYLGTLFFDKLNEKIAGIDISHWYELEKKGHGYLKNIKPTLIRKSLKAESIVGIWEPYTPPTSDEKYCVMYTTDFGNAFFEVYRQKILPLSKENADDFVNNFYLNVDNERRNEDNSKTIKAEVLVYSNTLAEKYDVFKNYYTPLVYFIDKDNKPLMNDKYIITISDIFNFDMLKKNFEKNNIDISKFELKILENDEKFDSFLLKEYYSSKEFEGLVIDPFIKNNKIIDGIKIIGFDKAVEYIKRKAN